MSKKKYNVTLDDVSTLVDDTTVIDDTDNVIVDEVNEVISELPDDTIAITDVVTSKVKYSTKSCKVLNIISRNKVIIDFDGFGIIVSVADTKVKTVDIKYTGTIGKPDFQYEVV